MTKIKAGVYKYIANNDEVYILRGGLYWEAGQKYWVANQCETLDECHDYNSCCVTMPSRKSLIEWIESF